MHHPKVKHDGGNTRLPFKFSGGFGLGSSRIGTLFTMYGVIGCFIQFLIFPPVARRYGVLRCFKGEFVSFWILDPALGIRDSILPHLWQHHSHRGKLIDHSLRSNVPRNLFRNALHRTHRIKSQPTSHYVCSHGSYSSPSLACQRPYTITSSPYPLPPPPFSSTSPQALKFIPKQQQLIPQC